MQQPQVTDVRAIVDAVRSLGSVHYPLAAIPGDFIGWRRRVRQAARAAGLSISVTRTGDVVIVENRDYEVSEDEDLATADVMEGWLTGERVAYDEALYARRRDRIRIVSPFKNDDG